MERGRERGSDRERGRWRKVARTGKKEIKSERKDGSKKMPQEHVNHGEGMADSGRTEERRGGSEKGEKENK